MLVNSQGGGLVVCAALRVASWLTLVWWYRAFIFLSLSYIFFFYWFSFIFFFSLSLFLSLSLSLFLSFSLSQNYASPKILVFFCFIGFFSTNLLLDLYQTFFYILRKTCVVIFSLHFFLYHFSLVFFLSFFFFSLFPTYPFTLPILTTVSPLNIIPSHLIFFQ